jgi:hypothetical protein
MVTTPMLKDMVRAGALDSDFYDEVEHDPSRNREVVFIVLFANTLAAVGAWIGLGEVVGLGIWETLRDWLGIGTWTAPSEGGFLFLVVTNVALAFVGWIVWAATTGFIGIRVFGGTTDFGEMMRVLGYAQAPRAIAVIPWLGPVAGVWTLVASVVAIRQGQDFSTAKAVGSAIGGWLVWWLLQFGVSAIGALLFG